MMSIYETVKHNIIGRNNETTAKLVFLIKVNFLFFLQTDLLTTHKAHVIIPNDTIRKLNKNYFFIITPPTAKI